MPNIIPRFLGKFPLYLTTAAVGIAYCSIVTSTLSPTPSKMFLVNKLILLINRLNLDAKFSTANKYRTNTGLIDLFDNQ